MSCIACKRDIELPARGLCRACYGRWWKRGTTEYAPKRERQRCQVKDCGAFVVSNGLCDKHRLRLRDHGHLEDTRPESWGAIEKHPLKNSWRWIKRHSGLEPICAEWEADFLQFVSDVGERPSKKHKLFRADDSRPIGPDNFVWKLSITQKAEGEDLQTYRSRCQRVYRNLRQEFYRSNHLKKKFGMTLADYEQMFNAQNGRCAICQKIETLAIRGKTLSLSVDHCHSSGQIRALLCSQCNQGLGCFKDDPRLLRRAALYVAA